MTESVRERRVSPAQAVGALAAVLVILLLLWLFVFQGDGEDVDSATPAAPAPATSPEGEEEEEEDVPANDGPRNGPVETFEVFAPKDPFDPLISASTGGAPGEADAAAGDGDATADDGTTVVDGTGTTSGDGTGTTTTTTTSGGGGGEDVNGHRVRVIDVYREGGNGRAQVQVDGTVYTVDEGERFAENFRLMSTSGACATMLYGDDEFTLCEGEEILK